MLNNFYILTDLFSGRMSPTIEKKNFFNLYELPPPPSLPASGTFLAERMLSRLIQ